MRRMLKSHFQMEKNSQCSIGEIIRLKKWLKKTIKKIKIYFFKYFSNAINGSFCNLIRKVRPLDIDILAILWGFDTYN